MTWKKISEKFIIHIFFSSRLVGDPEKWDADTITFYDEENFSGDDEMYDDVNKSAEDLNNPG